MSWRQADAAKKTPACKRSQHRTGIDDRPNYRVEREVSLKGDYFFPGGFAGRAGLAGRAGRLLRADLAGGAFLAR
jgi:hypothetical protein